MKHELKDLLKPPFYWNKGKLKLTDHAWIEFYRSTIRVESLSLVEFIRLAFNEKYERDFGELKRWIKKYILGMRVLFCPKCDFSTSLNGLMDNELNYCPNCGQKLLLPKEEV